MSNETVITIVGNLTADTDCRHPEPVDDGECWEGCCDRYRCPDCGARWKVEYDG